MAKSKKVTKKRIVVIEPVGQAHINATFNNIIITLTNNSGQTISWSSGISNLVFMVCLFLGHVWFLLCDELDA